MVGIQGRLGDAEHPAPHPSSSLTGEERCTEYAADGFSVTVLFHDRSRNRTLHFSCDPTMFRPLCSTTP